MQGHRSPSNDTDIQFVHPANREILNPEPSLGETASAATIGNSSDSASEIFDDGLGQSSDITRMSCKRKSLELNIGQSSEAGSSNYFQHSERNMTENEPITSNRETPESSRRNFRLRINGNQDHHHEPANLTLPNPVNSNFLPSSQIPAENGSFSNVPFASRNPQSTLVGSSSFSNEATFVPAIEIGISPQQPTNWDLASGNNINNTNIPENIWLASRSASNSEINPSDSFWPNRSRPQYSRQLSEIVRRSFLSRASVGHQSVRRLGSASGNFDQHLSGSGSTLSEQRHVDGTSELPYSIRNIAGGNGEGRTSMMSEIRHVLDVMGRGEGLRFEDMMMLDQSGLFGIADLRDRHREMRLDVDNMSYEDLLALEDRIGNVCTGLNEETITVHLKLQKYIIGGVENWEPCSICREEYNGGEDLGSLRCGHDFHVDCIKQWLKRKNLCPICKTTGLAV